MGNLVNVVFPIMTLIIGGACAMLLISTKTLRDSRDDQEKRITFLEAQHTRDAETISGQAAQLDALGKVVTGEVYLVAIDSLLTQHHSDATGYWKLMLPLLKHIDATLTKLIETLGGPQ